MLKLIIYLIFIISVAVSAIGIILSSRLRNKYSSDIFSALVYFQVFIYTFGFYGIWGQVVIKSFLTTLISQGLLSRLSDMAIILGLPFLIFAWFMLIRFSGSLSGRIRSNWFVLWFLTVNFIILATLGYFTVKSESYNTTVIIKDYYIIMNLIHFFIASYLIHFPWKGRPLIHDHDRRIIAPSLFLIMIIQCMPLLLYKNQTWIAVIFIFTFFLGNVFLPVYFSYGTLLSAYTTETETNISFEEFCRRYDVSPRESDVIREICNGLSNKEISDKLFISLQTVKDHTHHIYIKTNVKSRVQLINLIKDLMIK
jgi:DNA-binding CsgD family transcriptional regulator